ncbi:hypothetical protein HQ39_04515 [Porphyromonas sp. COT-108 OH2963]|nr:hypothetical protein HQ39_04515 [Porphyromonas sp. COT-108 OH2963]
MSLQSGKREEASGTVPKHCFYIKHTDPDRSYFAPFRSIRARLFFFPFKREESTLSKQVCYNVFS